jgi:hypothetical protein
MDFYTFVVYLYRVEVKGHTSAIRHPPSARMALIISNISKRVLADVNILIEICILI